MKGMERWPDIDFILGLTSKEKGLILFSDNSLDITKKKKKKWWKSAKTLKCVQKCDKKMY